MSVCIVTGSGGLVGSTAARFFSEHGFDVVGIDNDMRARFFGAEASTAWNVKVLEKDLTRYRHVVADISDDCAMMSLFAEYGDRVALVIHTAAQPSHDWAANSPAVDFQVNAVGTLNLLEKLRRFCPEAVFIFTSTNKVYGDTPNQLPLIEKATRFELHKAHPFGTHGIDESMPVDKSLHSLFGASKLSADILVQEYGRYFGIPTACFRAGCITGGTHSATRLHGFLAYLIRCAVLNEPYSVIGYGGKQVRDNIHAEDLVGMFWEFFKNPRPGEVYNAGGGPSTSVSVLEAIERCENMTGRKMTIRYVPEARRGDHMWWITDCRRFEGHYPSWRQNYGRDEIFEDILTHMANRFGCRPGERITACELADVGCW